MQNVKTTLALIAAYGLATFAPDPGLWLSSLRIGTEAIRLPQILLALLLLSAGICISPGAWRSVLVFKKQLLLSAILSWAVPALSALLTVIVVWRFGCPASVALGIVIVASMPIANSSVGWSSLLGGHLAMSVALLVGANALSPVISPFLISLGAQGIGTAQKELLDAPWSQGMGLFFFAWVLVPVLVGVLIAGRISSERSQSMKPHLRQASFGILVVLNYLNASACLPSLVQQPSLLVWPLLATTLLFCVSSGAAQLLCAVSNSQSTELFRLNRPHQNSLMLAMLMRNTGAALVFAGEALPAFALVSITIVSYTLIQHLGVGIVLRRRSAAHRDPLPDSSGQAVSARSAAIEEHAVSSP